MKRLSIILLAVIALSITSFAQIVRDAVILKPYETFVDNSIKDKTKNIVTVSRSIEVYDIAGVQSSTSLSTRAFSLPAYGDSIKFNYSAYDTSVTGNANQTLILKGYFTPGGTGTTIDTLVKKDSSETRIIGSYTVAGTVYPYYGLTIARGAGNPVDGTFDVKIFAVAMKNQQ